MNREVAVNSTPKLLNLVQAEADFREMAFRIVYHRMFANITDLATRFACALVYSAKEMKDRTLFEIWSQWTGGKPIKSLLSAGKEPPAELRPFVESYLRAVRERAQETGDEVAELI